MILKGHLIEDRLSNLPSVVLLELSTRETWPCEDVPFWSVSVGKVDGKNLLCFKGANRVSDHKADIGLPPTKVAVDSASRSAWPLPDLAT